MKRITWDKRTQFQGRNGVFNCNGVGVFRMSDLNPEKFDKTIEQKAIRLYPITSKGGVGVGFIEIPARKEVIDQLIRALLSEIS